jgi:hypothetical protein
MDQKEIEQFSEQVKALQEALAGLTNSAEKADASISGELSKKFPNAAKPSIEALKGLGNAVTDVTAALYRGERGMKVMANGIDTLVDGLQAAAAIFTMFTPMGKALSLGSKLLINGVAAAAKGVSSLNKLNAEQSDRLYKVYQDLSNVGAAGAGGLEKLFDSMQQAGFTAAELDQFANALKRNAQDLAVFGASTAQGAENLAKMSGGILKGDLGLALTNLGYNAESLANSTATYLALQNRLGNIQTKTAYQLQREAGAYAVELDKLTRLTGLSREEQEKRQRSLMSDERYASFMATTARTEGYDTAALDNFFSLIQDESTRKGLQHMLASRGGATSEESRRIMQTDPMAYQRMMQVARGGSAVGAAQGFYGAAQKYMTGIGGQVGQFTGQGPGISVAANLEYAERIKQMGAAAAKTGQTLDESLKSEQAKIAADQGELKRQNELRLQQMGAAQALDSTVKKFTLLNSVTDTLSSAFSNLATTLGGKAGGGAPVGGAGTTNLPQGGPGAVGADLSGLRIKSGEAVAGGATSQGLAQLARTIQDKLGGDLRHFSAFNDSYHQGTDSAHAKGTALDFTLTDPKKAAQIAAIVRGLPGVKSVRDEYSNPSSRATAGHIHTEINGASGFGGMLSGPMSGYRPNILMHGTEELSIRPMGRTSDDTSSSNMGLGEMVSELKELVYISQKQLYTAQKILKYQQ